MITTYPRLTQFEARALVQYAIAHGLAGVPSHQVTYEDVRRQQVREAMRRHRARQIAGVRKGKI